MVGRPANRSPTIRIPWFIFFFFSFFLANFESLVAVFVAPTASIGDGPLLGCLGKKHVRVIRPSQRANGLGRWTTQCHARSQQDEKSQAAK